MNFIELTRQYEAYKTEIDRRMAAVINGSRFIMGEEVAELETKLADFVGANYGIGCASGTDALVLSLMTYDLQPGDEIITTPFTFFATGEAIALLKAKPVFIDIRPDTYNIDPAKIPAAITSRTRGIIAVDIFGQCADYDEINTIARSKKLFVIEDAAQSLGAEYKGRKAGNLADIGCTSFFPAKPLGCFGDGGMIFTNDEAKAKLLRSLRMHGSGGNKYDNVRVGLNSRLDTLQAAILLAKFAHFPEEIHLRNGKAEIYNARLPQTIQRPVVLEHNIPVWAQYSIRVKKREQLQKFLTTNNIPTAIHYPKPLHLQPAFAALGYKAGAFPVTESICAEILALPMSPFLLPEEQKLIIDRMGFYFKLSG